MDIPFQNKKFLIAKFGVAFAGLTTVTYSVQNADGAVVVLPTSQNVVEIGGGDYGALINFEPDIFQLNFTGYILWDTGTGATFSESINIISDISENVLMLFDRNVEYDFVIASAADPSRNVLVGMYDGVIVRVKLNSQDNFENPIFQDFIRFHYRTASLDSDVIKKSVAEDIDGYGGYAYGYGY